jgi:hypothetical protein
MLHSNRLAVAVALLTFATVPSVAAAKAKRAVAPVISPEEKLAESLWRLRAALNVAALQCQYDAALNTVANFNQLIKLHRSELEGARATMESRFRRIYGRGGVSAFDKYNTKTWNGFSTVTAQRPFCGKSSEVGTEALVTPVGSLTVLANNRLSEIEAVFPKPEMAKPAVKAGKKRSKKRSKR